jgi:hypothetical protein
MYKGDNSSMSPLAFRTHPQFRGLNLWSDTSANPIIGADAQQRRYLGLGVWERSAGAVLYTGSTSTYTEPTFV